MSMKSINSKKFASKLEVFLYPRGFIRCLQWLFALTTFTIATDFLSKLSSDLSYLYQRDTANPELFTMPGNFASDVQFVIFVGVLSWIYSFLSIGMYTFYSDLYGDKKNKYPKLDTIITTMLAILWLAAAAAMANGMSGVHLRTGSNRIWTGHLCVLLAFVDSFLWLGNIWFLFKETSWFRMRQAVVVKEGGNVGEVSLQECTVVVKE